MVDLFEEIKEDVKQERHARLWSKYGKYLIGAAISIVLATAITVGWKSYKTGKYEKAGDVLYKANQQYDKGNYNDALESYSNLEEKNISSTTSFAALKKADILTKQGKVSEAIEVYKKISDNSSNPKEVRELARILYLYNSYENSLATAELSKEIEQYANSEGSLFAANAKELLALVKYDADKKDESLAILTALNESMKTPPAMRRRVGELIDVINSEG